MWKKIKSWIPTPYRVMRWYSTSQDTLHDFHKTHAVTAFVLFTATLCVAMLAYRADWGVLYGIELASTNNSTGAWWEATVFAAIVQLLILFNGNMVIRLWLHGVHRQGEHYTQFKVNSVLFAIGMGATLFLSWESDYSAKGKNITAVEQNRIAHAAELDSIEDRYHARIEKLEAKYIADSARAVAMHSPIINSLQNERDSIVAKKNSDGKYDSAKSYSIEYNKKIRRIQDSIRTELTPLHDALVSDRARIQRERNEEKNSVDYHYSSEGFRLKTDGSFNGAFTRWKNVLLNFLSIVLSFMVQTFVRGSNAQFGGGSTPLYSVPKIQKNRIVSETEPETEEDPETEKTAGFSGFEGLDLSSFTTPHGEFATPHNAKDHNATAYNVASDKSGATAATEDKYAVVDVAEENTAPTIESVQEGVGIELDYSAIDDKGTALEIEELQNGVDYSKPRFNGGSIAANQRTVWRKNEQGKIEVLYYGKDNNEWRNKSWFFSQRANRLDKAKKAGKNVDAMRNNHLWAGLHDRIIDFIESKEKDGGE